MLLNILSYCLLYLTWDICIWCSSPHPTLELSIAVYSYPYQTSIHRSMEHSKPAGQHSIVGIRLMSDWWTLPKYHIFDNKNIIAWTLSRTFHNDRLRLIYVSNYQLVCVIHVLDLMCIVFLYFYQCLYSTETLYWLRPCLNSASGLSLLTECMQKCV